MLFTAAKVTDAVTAETIKRTIIIGILGVLFLVTAPTIYAIFDEFKHDRKKLFIAAILSFISFVTAFCFGRYLKYYARL